MGPRRSVSEAAERRSFIVEMKFGQVRPLMDGTGLEVG